MAPEWTFPVQVQKACQLRESPYSAVTSGSFALRFTQNAIDFAGRGCRMQMHLASGSQTAKPPLG